eukprot:scaffold113675_cov52-Prasinocladus_malaysianus.AAC.2
MHGSWLPPVICRYGSLPYGFVVFRVCEYGYGTGMPRPTREDSLYEYLGCEGWILRAAASGDYRRCVAARLS